MIPMLRGTAAVTQTVIKGSKVASPLFVQSAKKGINKVDTFYDDITFNSITQIQKVSPTLTNYIISNPVKIVGGVEVINDVFNPSAPIPSTFRGSMGVMIDKIITIDKEHVTDTVNYIKNLTPNIVKKESISDK